MTLDSFSTVFLTLAFLVPGYIISWVLSRLAPSRPRQTQEFLLASLALSCVNYAVWVWLIVLIGSSEFFTQFPGRSAAGWFIVIFIGPAILGLAIGALGRKDVFRQLLQKAGFAPLHEVPTAWDYRFHSSEEPSWIIVTLKDGSLVRGVFGNRSFASGDPSERDLYIETTYTVDEVGKWQRVRKSDGILIRHDQIKWIEFVELETEGEV